MYNLAIRECGPRLAFGKYDEYNKYDSYTEMQEIYTAPPRLAINCV